MRKTRRARESTRPLPLSHPWTNSDGHLEVDVAIIGGGAAGFYTAMRLAMSPQYAAKRIAVFEATQRVGGRVLTLKPPTLPFSADIGAMRFLPHQAIISTLARHLKLKTYTHAFPTWSYFVRGRDIRPWKTAPAGMKTLPERPLSTPAEAAEAFVPQTAYRDLNPEELALEPSGLIALAISRLLKDIEIATEYNTSGLSPNAGALVNLRTTIRSLSAKGATLNYRDLSPYQWHAIRRFGEYDGRRLFKLGFWDMIQLHLSPEAFKFVEDGLGYHSIIGTWNAAEAIPWYLADFSGASYESFVGGMESIVAAMSDAFVAQALKSFPGLQAQHFCLLGWELESASQLQHRADLTLDRSQLLTFTESEVISRPKPFSDSGRSAAHIKRVARSVFASHVVLCMSKGALERLDIEGYEPPSSPTPHTCGRYFHSLLGSVSAHPLLKTFLWFKEPWWFTKCKETSYLDGIQATASTAPKEQISDFAAPNDSFVAARVFTDLPLRMIYYHGPCSRSRHSSSKPGYAMIMAYCDARHAAYWDSLNDVIPNEDVWIEGDLKTEMEKTAPDDASHFEFGVTATFAHRMHMQLGRFHRYTTRLDLDHHGIPVSPPCVFGLYTNWSRAPFFGGWHTWRIDFDAWEMQRQITQPFPGHFLYVCGEAYSFDQGWIEGALKTAERILISKTAFGIDEADWPGYGDAVEALRYRSRCDYVNI